jgi:hypothetical protein
MSLSESITDRSWFQWFIAVVIVLNIIAIGVETDSSCTGCDKRTEKLWLGINSVFASIYVTEFALKFRDKGFACLRGIPQVLDFLLVLIAIVDTWILQFVIQSHSVRSLSMLRVLRVVRLSRVLKFMTRQTELRLLIQSFREMYKYMLPLLVAMLFIVYFSSLIMRCFYDQSDELAYSRYGRWPGSEYWGSILRNMFTMFQMATGDNWSTVARPLVRSQPLYLFLFIPFLLCMFIAFRSYMIARACDSVIQSGSVAERRLKLAEQKTQALLNTLKQKFVDLKLQPGGNLSGDGYLNYNELLVFSRIESNRKILSSLNVPVSDLGELLCILGDDIKMKVDINFYFSCILRLTGPAMGRHVTSIQMKTQSMATKAATAIHRVANMQDKIRRIEIDLAEVAQRYGLKNGSTIDPDPFVITAEINESGGSSALRGSTSSLSLRSRKGRSLREKYKESRFKQRTTPFASFIIE